CEDKEVTSPGTTRGEKTRRELAPSPSGYWRRSSSRSWVARSGLRQQQSFAGDCKLLIAKILGHCKRTARGLVGKSAAWLSIPSGGKMTHLPTMLGFII